MCPSVIGDDERDRLGGFGGGVVVGQPDVVLAAVGAGRARRPLLDSTMSTFGSLCSASIEAMKLSALLSTPKPPSIGLLTSEPTVSTALSRSVVAGSSGWNSSPLRSAASSSMPRNAPDSVTAPSRRPVRRAGVDEQFGDLDRVVERVGADDAGFAGDGVERLDAAGERAGMRQRGAAAGFRLAELDGDHRLAGGARQPAGGLELRDLRDRLDIDDDDLELGLVGEERDVVGERQSGLVAAGDQVAGRMPRSCSAWLV